MSSQVPHASFRPTPGTTSRALGALDVSPLGLGCWNFGRVLDEPTSLTVVRAALDAGVTFFDVADGYGAGLAEEYLGRGLGRRRKEVVVATKFGAARGHGHRTALGYRACEGGGRPDYVRACIEGSLRRLGTDYLDLVQMHDPDPSTPVEDTLGELNVLVSEGLVREIGCSNHDGDQLVHAAGVAATSGLRPFRSIQNQFSLLHQVPVDDVLPACRTLDMALLPYFPLANGVLTGKYLESPVESSTRLGVFMKEDRPDKVARFLNPVTRRRVTSLDTYARGQGISLLDLAFGWLLAHDEVASVIAGASSAEQVAANAHSVTRALTTDQMADVARILDDGLPLICDDFGAEP